MYPIDDNFRMPAEWERHTRSFVAWPVQDSMVYPSDYDAVCDGFQQVVQAIAEFEPVTVVADVDDAAAVTRRFGQQGHPGQNAVTVLAVPHNDSWIRDNGPTFIVDGTGLVAGVNWKFNAWGGKYAPWDLDDAVAPHVLEHYKIPKYDAPFVLEGGSIHVDGEGTLLTTEECLLNPNRNPNLSKEDIEAYLHKFLNVNKVIWLKRGLHGDETDGHVDNVACFAAPGKILMQVCDDVNDENYEITQENLAILKAAVDAKGRSLEVIPIAQPPAVMHEDSRLTLSYLNFYFVNDGIILPVFGGSSTDTDKRAEQMLSQTFPTRKIRTVNGMAIIREGGNVHCITQQMPAGR